MMVECAVYGFISGLLMQRIRSGKLSLDLYISLLSAMLSGRILSGAVKALLFARGSITLASWAAGSFVTGLPGIVIQLLLLPAIVLALSKARLIPPRYPREK